MEHFLFGLSIFLKWETYAYALIYMLIFIPHLAITSNLFKGGWLGPKVNIESFSIYSFLGNKFLGVFLQAAAVVVLYMGIGSMVVDMINPGTVSFSTVLLEDIPRLFSILLSENFISGLMGLGFIVGLLLLFSGTDFDFLIGIIFFNWVYQSTFFPAIPDFFTILWVGLGALILIFVVPFLAFPINKLFGEEEFLDNPGYSQSALESLTMNYFQIVFALLPVAIYMHWSILQT
tara:strand:+ start:1759 stop:2457 length:699 start_codon:yes stop_codon:yes gene_type:complete